MPILGNDTLNAEEHLKERAVLHPISPFWTNKPIDELSFTYPVSVW